MCNSSIEWYNSIEQFNYIEWYNSSIEWYKSIEWYNSSIELYHYIKLFLLWMGIIPVSGRILLNGVILLLNGIISVE